MNISEAYTTLGLPDGSSYEMVHEAYKKRITSLSSLPESEVNASMLARTEEAWNTINTNMIPGSMPMDDYQSGTELAVRASSDIQTTSPVLQHSTVCALLRLC